MLKSHRRAQATVCRVKKKKPPSKVNKHLGDHSIIQNGGTLNRNHHETPSLAQVALAREDAKVLQQKARHKNRPFHILQTETFS